MKYKLFAFIFTISILTVSGQTKSVDEKEKESARRFKQAKQDFVDGRFNKVLFYYDSIINLYGRTGIINHKMAFESYQGLMKINPEKSDSLSMKADQAYGQALKWYGKPFLSDHWDNIVIAPDGGPVNNFKFDKEPTYPGGIQAFYKYIAENVNYPEGARQAGIEGKVYVIFMVDKEGNINTANIARGICKECDAEALRVVRNAERFTPGMRNGKPQHARMMLPVVFKLTSSYDSKEEKRRKRRMKRRKRRNG